MSDQYNYYLDRKVSELVQVEVAEIPEPEKERHRIFSLLIMAVAADVFNGNRWGSTVEYPWRERQKAADGRYDGWGERYLGHNIACLAVDGRGEIIDYEFNHNELYRSSAEHAEARLVRRIFAINDGFEHWAARDPDDEVRDTPYVSLLNTVTIYTTLESCAQCSGVMQLGNVRRVVYLQQDPDQFGIGNILYNLSNTLDVTHPVSRPPVDGRPRTKGYGAPEPIDADRFDFDLKGRMEAAFRDYRQGVKTTPFCKWPPGGRRPDHSEVVTSFLCTDAARDIFVEAGERLDAADVAHPDYQPEVPPRTSPALTNREVLVQARAFRKWALKSGQRATSHR